MKTKVVNITAGEKYDVYIGRKGKGRDGYFGNPFAVGPGRTRTQSIYEYRAYFQDKIKYDQEFKKRIEELKGKVLGCFCKPLPCHGDVIVEYLEGKE